MKYLIISIIALFVISGFSQSKFDNALKTAKAENKKVIIDVYTDWCGWCKKMDKESYGNSKVQDIIEDNFIIVKLDAEGNGKNNFNGKTYTDTQLAEYFQVTGYPTTVFLDSEGKLIEFKYDSYKVKSFPGYLSASELLKILNFIKDDKYIDTDLNTVL